MILIENWVADIGQPLSASCCCHSDVGHPRPAADAEECPARHTDQGCVQGQPVQEVALAADAHQPAGMPSNMSVCKISQLLCCLQTCQPTSMLSSTSVCKISKLLRCQQTCQSTGVPSNGWICKKKMNQCFAASRLWSSINRYMLSNMFAPPPSGTFK